MTDCIWLSNVYGDSMSGRGFRSMRPDHDGKDPDPRTVEAITKAKRGELLDDSDVPTDFFALRDFNAHRQAPLHIFTNGFLIITEECAAVLRRFDLGECRLHPVRLWHPDRKTRFGTGHYVLNFASRKDAFLPDRSPLARYEAYINGPASAQGKPGFWMLPPNEGDDQLVFSKTALDGPDVWWDPSFFNLFFLSHRLAPALKAARLAKHWRLYRCPVV